MNESRQSGGTGTLGPSLGKPSPASGRLRQHSSARPGMREGGRNVGPGLRLDFDTKDVYHDVDSDFVSVSQGRDGLLFEDDEMSSADSADIIAQAKYRLRSLDKEAHVSFLWMLR